MALYRITQPKESEDEDGVYYGEAVVEPLQIPNEMRLKDGERESALLAEAQRNREAERYGALVRQPTKQPLTAQEAEMAEKTQEQLDRESVHTSGPRFEEIQKQEEEKLAVENAVTAHAGVVKVSDGREQRLIPTAENYSREPGERSEGIKVQDAVPLAVSPNAAGPVGFGPIDDAERKLQVAKLGTHSQAQHATGSSDARDALAAKESGKLEEVGGEVISEKEVQKQEEGGRKAATKAAEQDSKQEGPSKASQVEGGATKSSSKK